MAKTLVLTEKPSVARDIARVLGCKRNGNGCIIGDKYTITWALGHLVTLADPEVYGEKYKSWKMEDLPMLPEKMKLVVIGQTANQFKAVSALLNSNEYDKVVIATDASWSRGGFSSRRAAASRFRDSGFHPRRIRR